MTNIRRTVKNKFGEKQGVIQRWPAELGDGNGLVDVPGQTGYVYVQLAGQTTTCYNRRVQANHGTPVIVGYDPKEPRLFQVLDIWEGAASNLPGVNAGMRPHGTTHRFGGTDPVWVDLQQFLPLLPYPNGSIGVNLYRCILHTGTEYKSVGAQSVDLSSYVPVTTGKALFCLLSIDATGGLVVSVGSEVDIADLALTDIPAPTAGTIFSICAIRLYEGMTAVQSGQTNTDIVDLRFPGRSGGASFDDTEGDPASVSTIPSSDGTSTNAARRDHRHQISLSILHEHIYQEDHTGECDGAKTIFLTAQEYQPETIRVFLNGLLQRPTIVTEGAFYDQVTLATAPVSGDELIMEYVTA